MNHEVKEFLHDMIPAAISLVFMSLYMIVDGAFVSLYVGADALAAINIVYPIAELMYAFGSMFAAGTSVFVSIRLGQGKKEEAEESFGMGFMVSLITGLLLMIVFLAFLRPVCVALGATDRTMEYCISYGVATCVAIPCGMMKEMYLFMLRCDNAPRLSMLVSIAGGMTNVVLDYLFVAVFGWGIGGAGWATVIGMVVGAMIGAVYFALPRDGLKLHCVRPALSFIVDISVKGMSNFTNNFAAAIITFIYNMVTLPLAGEEGVAAVTMILYAQFLFLSVFTGYMAGAAPLFGFHYGAGDAQRNQRLFRFCGILVVTSSIVMFVLAEWIGGDLIGMLVTDAQVDRLARHGIRIYAVSFLAAGANIFISGVFASFGNGLDGGLIAFSRSLVVLGVSLLVLPRWMGVDGIWAAAVVAETVTFAISLYLLFKRENREKYQYL